MMGILMRQRRGDFRKGRCVAHTYNTSTQEAEAGLHSQTLSQLKKKRKKGKER
jgi:hypothetical protein